MIENIKILELELEILEDETTIEKNKAPINLYLREKYTYVLDEQLYALLYSCKISYKSILV